MDNITHTLVGVLVGEAVARGPAALRVRKRAGTGPAAPGLPAHVRRSLIVTTFAVASNLPDLDVLYTALARSPLAYPLEHRGYTHTLPGALGLALLLWLLCEGWLRWRRLAPSPADHGWIAGSACAGVLLHLAMDYTNSYGVHPFWPFYDGWLYGDSVFIVEPLIWLAATPLLFLLRTRLARLLVGAALALDTLAVTGSGLVPALPAAAFVLLLMAALAAGRWLPPRAALASGLGLWLAVTALFMAAGHVAAARAGAIAQQRFAGAITRDPVLTPMPADPVCWDLLLVQEQAGHYLVRMAHLSLAPRWIRAQDCRGPGSLMQRTGAAPLAGGAGPGLQWLGEFDMPIDRIARLASRYCDAGAFMQFARVPWASEDGNAWRMGDLRFGNGSRFAQLRLSGPPGPCSVAPVPWLPPRPELLK